MLLPGAKAPHLVKRADLKVMKPGSVIVDVAVDQGGCVETIKPTTHENPTYFVDGILHYAVANMPGGVPRTSTLALTNATLPYGLRLAKHGWKKACKDDRALASASTWSRARWSIRAWRRRSACRWWTWRPSSRTARRDRSHARCPTSSIAPPAARRGAPAPRAGPRPGRPGYDLASAEDGELAPMERRLFAPDLRLPSRRASSASSGPARGWPSSTGSPFPTPRPPSTATTGAS